MQTTLLDESSKQAPEDLYDIGELPPLGHVPKKMHAWVIRRERYGEPLTSFRQEVVAVPPVSDDKVLVLTMAAGINYNAIWAGRGSPVDVIAQGKQSDFHIAGTDGSGIVWKVGRNVKGFRVGDQVVLVGNQWEENCPLVKAGGDPVFSDTFKAWGYETSWGSFAQFCLVQPHQCLPRPTHLTWEDSAVYMASGVAAYRMLYRWRENALRAGDVVLIWGGAGGLGCQAIQLVRHAGGVPIAVVSDDTKPEFCKRLGAKGCINRLEYDHWGSLPPFGDREAYSRWLKGSPGSGKGGALQFRRAIWDIVGEKRNPRIVFEHPGEDTIPTSLFVCDTGGMIVTCAGTTGYHASVDLRYLWMRQKRLQGSHAANAEEASQFNQLVRDKIVDPCVSRVLSWDELALGHQLMADNRHPPGNMGVLVGAKRTGLGADVS